MAGHGRKAPVTGVHTLDGLIETAKQEADWTGMLLDRPEGDWPLMVFVGSVSGEVATYVGPHDVPSRAKEERDRFWLETLPRVLWQKPAAAPARVARLAVLVSTWCPLLTPPDAVSESPEARCNAGVRQGQPPLGYEVLLLRAAAPGEVRALQAPVVRRARKPPLVGEWEELPHAAASMGDFCAVMVGAGEAVRLGAHVGRRAPQRRTPRAGRTRGPGNAASDEAPSARASGRRGYADRSGIQL